MKHMILGILGISLALQAQAWDWSAKSGAVTISAGEGTVEVTDADLAYVEALTSLAIESGATLKLVNTSRALNATFPISGGGAITSSTAGGIILAGNNSGHTGAMTFSGTPVTVSNRYGLGASSRTVSHSNARLLFTGGGLINDVPLSITGNRTAGTYGTLTEGNAVTWVQNGNITFNTANHTVTFFNCEINGETKFSSGGVVWGSGIVNFNGKLNFARANNAQFNISSGCEIHVKEYAGNWPNQQISGDGKYICEAEHVLSRDRAVGIRGTGNFFSGHLDLNGHDQQCSLMNHAATTSGDVSSKCDIYSRTAAKVIMSATTGTPASDYYFGGAFTGKAGLTFGRVSVAGDTRASQTGVTYKLKWAKSTTLGELAITNGHMVALVEGAAWYGDITLSGEDSCVSIDATSSLNPDGTGIIKLGTGGKLVLNNTSPVKCRRLIVNGAQLDDDTYSEANLSEWITGTGSIIAEDYEDVNSWTGEGNGWNDAANWTVAVPKAGEEVTIPKNLTATVNEVDAALVASLGKINIVGTLAFANTSKLILNAALAGTGAVTATGAGEIELAADNSEHTGAMTFDTTPVTVSHRYGLGADSRTVTHKNARLLFKGGGLTNDVPLALYGSRTAGTYGTFTENLTDVWTQNGKVTTYSAAKIQLGAYVFNGGVEKASTCAEAAYEVWVDGAGDTALYLEYFTMNKRLNYTTFYLQNNSSMDIGCGPDGLPQSGNLTIAAAGTENRVRVYSENVFTQDRDLILGAVYYRYAFIDINGQDQKVSAVYSGATSPDPVNCPYIIHSDDPAAFVIVPITSGAERTATLKFTGKAGLKYTGDGKYTLSYVTSTSSGKIEVTGNGGEVALANGAVWAGDVKVSNGAKFSVDATSSLSKTSGVVLGDTGVLDIATGVQLEVASLAVGSVKCAPGTYSAESFPVNITGGGTIVVKAAWEKGETFVWTGNGSANFYDSGNWQDGKVPASDCTAIIKFGAGTSAATIPEGNPYFYGLIFDSGCDFTLSGGTLTVGPGGVKTSNGDVDNPVTYTLACNCQFDFPSEEEWTFEEGTVLNVTGDVSGGTVDQSFVLTGGGIVLSGDNSGLKAAMVLSNIVVEAQSMYALGSPDRKTVYAHTKMDDNEKVLPTELKFSGAGLTVGTPLKMYCLTAYNVQNRLVKNDADQLVFKGEFEYAPLKNTTLEYLNVGDYTRFEGGFACQNCAMLNLVGTGIGVSTVDVENVPFNFQTAKLSINELTFNVNTTGNKYAQIWCYAKWVCGLQDTTVAAAGDYQWSFGVDRTNGLLDLNGMDQTIKVIYSDNRQPTAGDTAHYGTVTSAAPAYFILNRTGGTAGTYQSAQAIKFTGKASVWQKGGPVGNKLMNVLSDTTGEIKVTDGRLLLANGCGFTSVSEVNISGGRLVVDTASACRAFGRGYGKSEAAMSISGDGALELEGDVATVASLNVGGVAKEVGYYGSADCTDERVPAANRLSCLSGAGVLRVRTKAGFMILFH